MATVQIPLNQNPKYQSPYAYLQAAGSDGADSSSPGIHLRWAFLRTLGANHLAKGNLSTTTPYTANYGFNKAKDFIRVYRAELKKVFAVTVNFNQVPSALTETGSTRIWRYNGFTPVPGVTANTTDVEVKFTDIALYDTLRTTVDPNTATLSFIQQYRGIIEIKTLNKHMFAGQFDLLAGPPVPSTAPFVKAESISLQHDSFDEPNHDYISCRKKMAPTQTKEERTFICENVQYFRFQYNVDYPEKIHLATYIDHIIGENGRENGNWEIVGDFSLTDDDATAFLRLEDTTKYLVDKKWSKFNDSDAISGAFKVKVNNYKNKWTSAEGLKEAVIDYLDLSKNPVSPAVANPQGITVIPSSQPDDQAQIEVNYLDLLNIVSLDFHAARMLGLGHIDKVATGNPDKPVPPAQAKKKYVYVMEYYTNIAIENVIPAQVTTHLYMSLPTSMQDYRLPPVPVMKDISYGLEVENCTPSPTQLTDNFGYTPYADERFVNLHRDKFRYELPFESFFATEDTFCICDESYPVNFGIEYRLSIETDNRKPELNHDDNYLDYAGIPETITIPETGEDPLFRHKETEEGKHRYSLYSVNWFSRVSPPSDPRETDVTIFEKRNTLLPPMNFAVQLIQEESPVIFTTSAEQVKLAALPGPDKTLVRLTFDWNQIHNQAYQFGDHAEFVFRPNAPRMVRGKIGNITQLANHKIKVSTTFYTITSTSPAQNIQPNILPADVSRFAGSLFSANEKIYIVEAVTSIGIGNNPEFILNQIRQTNPMDADNTNEFCVTEQFISPVADEIFMVVENMNEAANWDSLLTKKVFLESFHTVVTAELNGSSTFDNDGTYTIEKSELNAGNTELTVRESIANDTATSPGMLTYNKRVIVSGVDQPNQKFFISGDITSELSGGMSLNVTASKSSDGLFTIDTFTFNAGNSEITVNEPITDNAGNFYLTYEKSVNISSLNSAAKKIILAGNLTTEIVPVYREVRINSDATQTILNIGGIYASATITEILDKNGSGVPIAGSRTGVFEIQFDTYQLPNHIHFPEIEWYKGFVRIIEDAAFLPPSNDPTHTAAEMKMLQIFQIDNSSSTTLKIIAYDGTFAVADALNGDYTPIDGYVPIKTGASVNVNTHPSYRLYLQADTTGGNNFDQSTILPAIGEGSRQTYMASRSKDVIEALDSYFSTPVVLLAQEIVVPLPPEEPIGPAFATRPDFYGKSTYSFDVTVNTDGGRIPYALIFFRANERRVLDQLYKPETVRQILTDLASIPPPDLNFALRWQELVNVTTDGSGMFNVHGGFQFPIPDNPDYVIPNPDITVNIKPFVSNITPPGSGTIVSGTTQTMAVVVKECIEGAFLPLTEQPVVFGYLNTGMQTSGRLAKIKDSNGDLLIPGDAEFNPFPMAVKYVDGVDTKVRFTDYTLDGASKNFYFYFAVEFNNKLQVSDRSPVTKPVLLVNSAPAEEPAIKKTVSVLADPINSVPTSVKFELNKYIASEGIKKFHVYRATSHSDALTVRTMKLAKEADVDTDVIDDFSDVAFPLFGDPLFYRVVALREIKNEAGVSEFVPSKPSNIAFTNVVDTVNPPAPKIRSLNGTTTATELQNTILKWEPTCYNGTYSLQKQNASGNWVEIYKIKTNDASIQYPPLDNLNNPDFTNFPETAVLMRQDADGNNIYHRFRVKVENSSGLLNLTEKELTLAKGVTDIQEMDVVSYADSNHIINPLSTQEVDEGISQPVTMTFTDIASPLPAGHNSFVQTDITVTDDLGNTNTKTINTVGGSVTFIEGESSLILDNPSFPNRIYTIITKSFTDFASAGASKKYTLNYVSGPCHDLLQLANQLISLTDNTHTISPFTSQNVNDGVAYPTTLTIADISNLTSLGQVFSSMDVKITDDAGNTSTKTINAAAGSVTFDQTDGLELEITNPNRSYTIEATIKTDLCTTGTIFTYGAVYTFDPSEVLTTLTSLANFTDGNSQSINPLVDQNITAFTHPNATITITEIVSGILPSGHTFATMDVILEDDLGGSFLQTINAANGNVVFSQGDGGLKLDVNDPNRTYIITIILYTDVASNGVVFAYQVKYGV